MAPSPLKIKVNALNRLVKEEGLYKKELEQQQEKINKMKAENADEYEIKKQVCILWPMSSGKELTHYLIKYRLKFWRIQGR